METKKMKTLQTKKGSQVAHFALTFLIINTIKCKWVFLSSFINLFYDIVQQENPTANITMLYKRHYELLHILSQHKAFLKVILALRHFQVVSTS